MRRPNPTSGRPQLRLVPPPRARATERFPVPARHGSGRDGAGRDGKIELARRRMEQGYYERADVLDRIAESVLRYLRPSAEPTSP